MILVDTSIWTDHFRKSRTALVGLLETGIVCTHPFVIGELACGNLPRRKTTLRDLHNLPAVRPARDIEVLELIETRKLWGRGIGLIDVHLMAAAQIGHHQIWTRDRRLSELCADADINYDPAESS